MTSAPPRIASRVAWAASASASGRGLYLRDGAAVHAEPLQHGQLVRLAALHQVLETEVELPHPAQRSPGLQQVQPGPVLARHEVGDVTRRQPEPITSELHPAPPCPARLVPPGIFPDCGSPGMAFVYSGWRAASVGEGSRWPGLRRP